MELQTKVLNTVNVPIHFFKGTDTVMESKIYSMIRFFRPSLSILAHGKQHSEKAGNKANRCQLTSAVEFIFIQQVPYSTAAGKATNGIGTDLFTTSICSVALIDVWQ